MTTAQVVAMSVTLKNSPTQDYDHQDDHIPPTYEDFQCWFVNGDRTRERPLCNPALY